MKLGPISEDWARTIDSVAKLITALAIVFGGWWTLYQYFKGREDQQVTQRIEATKPLLQKRLDLYVDLSTAASTIVVSKNEKEAEAAKQRFWILYHGPVKLVADYPVSESMKQFGVCLQDKSKCQSSLTDLAEQLAINCSAALTRDFPRQRVPSGLTATVQ